MERTIWEKGLAEAKTDIVGGDRLVLLCFGNDSETSSKKTFSETLNDAAVTHVMGREFAAVKLDTSVDSALASQYLVNWAPEFVVIDENGRELERWAGYLPAKEFIEQMLISKARASLHLGRLEDASALFNEIVDDHSDSEFFLEAEYNVGVISLKTSGEMAKIADICETLNVEHPESIWAKRCIPWAHTGMKRPYVAYSGGGSVGSGAY